MNDLLYKGHFKGLDIAFTYAVTTSAVNEAVVRHDCDPAAAHILGRAMTGALLAAATNLLFALLAQLGASVPLLIGVVAMDNLSGGLAAAAFVAYLSALTNVQYSATQYALFSSVMLLMPKFLGGFSGVIVDRIGYEQFFILTALMGLPVLLLVWLAGRYTQPETRDDDV